MNTIGTLQVSALIRGHYRSEKFLALSGPNHDGNRFAANALEKGASVVVVSDPGMKGERIYFSEDPLRLLQQLAAHHRNQFSFPVIGLTGSNGKTTTKELIRDVLATRYNVHATKGNLNNHIGVPLSLLSVPLDAEIAVIEMGANHCGEIEFLSEICRPTHGLITNIGKAHIEGFGGIRGVKRGKSELYTFLGKAEGLAFVNVTEKYLESLSEGVDIRHFYGLYSAEEVLPDSVEFPMRLLQSEDEIRISLGNETFASPLFGIYNAHNIATAITLGKFFEVPSSDIARALRAYVSTNNRSQIAKKGERTVLLDAYNANPTSMQMAIVHFAQRPESKSVILGGMNELGESSLEEHQYLVDFLKDLDFQEVFLVGHHFGSFNLPEGMNWFETTSQLSDYLDSNSVSADAILIKGSRSFGLESILDHIH